MSEKHHHRVMKIRGLFMLLMVSMMSLQCHKDSEDLSVQIIKEDVPVIVDGISVGIITNEFGVNASDVDVVLAGHTKRLGEQPLYHFKSEMINHKGEAISIIDRNGDIHFNTIFPIANDVTYASIPILTSSEEFTFDATESTSINLPGGGSIRVGQNQFKSNSGDYTGSVRLKTRHYDMNDSYMQQALPGGKLAINSVGEPRILSISDAVLVEWSGESGQPLDLKPEEKVELYFSPELQSTNANLELWYYNLDIHRWESSGDAVIENDRIVGTIDKAGYWCLANSEKMIELTGSVRFDNVNLANLRVEIKWGENQLRQAFTTNQSNWSAFVPADKNLSLILFSNCGEQLMEQSLNPMVQDTDLGNIDVPGIDGRLSTIKGVVRDCQDDRLDESFIYMDFEGESSYYFSPSADLNHTILNCDINAIGIKSSTLSGDEIGPSINWSLQEELSIYSTYACRSAQQDYFTVRIKSNSKIYSGINTFLSEDDRTVFEIDNSSNPDLRLKILFTGQDAVMYPDNKINILFLDDEYSPSGYSLYCPTSNLGCGFEIFDVTHYGDGLGTWIRGYFKGNFWMRNLDNPAQAGMEEIEGEFQVYRSF